MGRTFNLQDSINMVSAVCTSYVTKDEIREYFKNNKDKYPEDYQFTGDDLKSIVKELTADKKRITKSMDEIGWKYKRKFTKKRNGEEER